MDVWHKRKSLGQGYMDGSLGQGYMDGGAQICVITNMCVEKMGLVVGWRIKILYSIGKSPESKVLRHCQGP